MQWGLRNIGQNTQPVEFGEPVFGTPGIDINAAAAWDVSTEAGGVVGIVDSGIEPRHPDLAENLNTTLSRNFAAEIGTEPGAPVDPQAWQDVHGHGTHVAGIVGAVGDNGLGVSGVNWRADVAALRACDASGSCHASDVAAAFAYAGQVGIPVVNASIGFDEGEGTPAEIQVVREAIADSPGTLYVTAAGNGDDFGVGFDVDQAPTYPCSFDLENLLCVAAITGARGVKRRASRAGLRIVQPGRPGTRTRRPATG